MPRHNLKCSRCGLETELIGDVYDIKQIECECGCEDLELVEYVRDEESALQRVSTRLSNIDERISKLEKAQDDEPSEGIWVTIH